MIDDVLPPSTSIPTEDAPPRTALPALPADVPRLTYSSLTTYDQCHFRYYLERVAKVPRAPSRSLILGDAVHKAIERDARARYLDLATGEIAGNGLPQESLETCFRDALREIARKADPYGCLDLDDYNLLVARGTAIIREYARLVAPSFRPVAIEEPFAAPMPRAGADNREWFFTGRLDARTLPRGRDGVSLPTTIDFKTAEKPWVVGREHESAQPTSYAWGDLASGRPIAARFTFLIFSTTVEDVAKWRATHDDALVSAALDIRVTRRDERDVARFQEHAYAVVGRIERDILAGDRFAAKPTPLCAFCDVLASCKVGRDWLAKQKRTPRPEIAQFVERAAVAAEDTSASGVDVPVEDA